MKFTAILPLILSGSILALSLQTASAGQSEPSTLTGKIQQFYAQMNKGEFENAFQFLKAGSNGFLPGGMLIKIPNEEVKAMVADEATKKREAGKRVTIYPKHIEIKMLGSDHAVAAYYVDGKNVENGEVKQVTRRVSLVLGREDGDWKILHWHSSRLSGSTDQVAGK